jgi:small redox-active disulfide protein 2
MHMKRLHQVFPGPECYLSHMDQSAHLVEVLGPGCRRCRETFRIVEEVVRDSGLSFEVVKSESPARMAELGVLSTPAIAIGGEVVAAGKIPTAAEVRTLLGVC